MISQWEPEDFTELLSEEQQETLSEFLEVERENINRQQRIILIAEAHDYALLMGPEWLSERYGVNIVCCRIAVAKDPETDSECLVCSNVYPAPELAAEAVPRGRRRAGRTTVRWPDWKTAIDSITNTAAAEYFRQQIESHRESYLRKRIVRYRVAGKRRWFVAARNKNAYVWQQGLSTPEDVKPVRRGECLRMFSNTAEEFQFFHRAATEKASAMQWIDVTAEELEEDSGE